MRQGKEKTRAVSSEEAQTLQPGAPPGGLRSVGDLRRRLERVKSRFRAVVLSAGLARVATALTAAFFLQFIFDWGFSLPYAGRLICAALFFGGVLYWAHQQVYRPLKALPDTDELALKVEKQYPELNDRLISTVQLDRRRATLETGAGGEPYLGSPALLAALEADALRSAAPLDFSRVVRFDPLRRHGSIAAAALAVLLLCVAFQPAYAEALVMRLVSPEYPYPTLTRIKTIRLRSGKLKLTDFPARVPHGNEVVFEVEADPESVIPDEPGAVEFRAADGLTVHVELERQGGSNLFVGRLAKMLEDADAVVYLGDARSKTLALKVVPRPEISSGTVSVYPPAYLKRPPAPAVPLGGFSGLQNGHAEITVTATKPLREARLERRDGRTFKLKPLDKEHRRWQLSAYPLDKSARIEFVLTDQEGLENGRPAPSYSVEAKPDVPPTVVMKAPVRDATVVPNARLRIKQKTTDDYGVERLWVVFRVVDEGREIESVQPRRILFPKDKTDKELLYWDLSGLGLRPGQRLLFHLEADDACPTNNTFDAQRLLRAGGRRPGPNDPTDGKTPIYSQSASVTMTVVTPEAKDLEISAKIVEIVQMLETISPEFDEKVYRRLLDLLEELKKQRKELRKKRGEK